MNNDIHIDEAVLNEYLDDMQEPSERMVLEAHLEHCTHCAAKLEGLRAVFLGLEKLPDLRLERDLAPHVLMTIASSFQAAPVASWKNWLTLALQALIALGFFLFTWPSVERWMSLKLAHSLNEQTVHEVLYQAGDWLAQWQTLGASIQIFLEQTIRNWLGRIEWPAWLRFSMSDLVLLLVVATVLCLIGNRLLLRPQKNHL